jgi:hypothetical protein
MDGLSGMKIYQSFQVDGKVLPLTYNSKDIQLIITSLSHDISPNGWLTKIETIAGPIFETISSLSTGTYSESGQIETPATNPELANQTGLSTPVELGTKADFWSLVAISAAENFINNPQGMADVAQSIYNRLAAKTYGKSIKSIIVSRGQYEPTFKNLNDWRAIKDEQTAIKAYQNSKRVSLLTATQAINTSKGALTNPLYAQEAKTLVGSRTEFLANFPQSNEAVGIIERSPSSKNNVFFWRYDGKNIFYDKNKLIAQNPPSNIFQLV